MGEQQLTPALSSLVRQIKQASSAKRPLHITGGGSKRFLAIASDAEELSSATLNGIVSYQPTELVITAQAGTPLQVIEAALAEQGQMLGFEPPALSADSTLGGAISCGWSGPGRPYRGSARDFVLGAQVVNGKGEVMNFGGEVMKNVAGYDIARLACGAYGALGLLAQVSLRVIPKPEREASLIWQLPVSEAGLKMRELARQPWPITAMAATESELAVRVSGSEEAVVDAIAKLAPERLLDADPRWTAIKDLSWATLQPPDGCALWRLSLPPSAPEFDGTLIVSDWGGAQRWLHAPASEPRIADFCRQHGGHATCIDRRDGLRGSALAEPDEALKNLMRKIKQAFDPAGIFNPGFYFGWM